MGGGIILKIQRRVILTRIMFRLNLTNDEDVVQPCSENVTVGILHVNNIEGTGVTLPRKIEINL